MASHLLHASRLGAPLLATLGVLFLVQPAMAQERAELDTLQATTQALIETLVESGVLSRDKADAMLAKAKAKAAAQAAAPEVGKDGKKVVRVPYVPESLKSEMRDQIKQELLVQARNERWGEPGAFPEWLNRFKLEGDLRLREERVGLSRSNSTPGLMNFFPADFSRAADIALNKGAASGNANFNTQDDFDRLRLRARLGVGAQVSEQVSAHFRLSTGNTTDRTSTNQTLGQSFNKYSVVFDQAYVALQPLDAITLTAGRVPNPFYSTDLVWADDLGFEGLAVSGRRPLFPGGQGFLTAGYFPLTESRPGSTGTRSLVGVQGGVDMKLGRTEHRFKVGMALYQYNGLEARKETFDDFSNNRPDYATREEYPTGFRQRGNTLFNVRAPGDAGTPVFGLASRFRELNLTAGLELVDVLPQPILLTGDFVKNLAFDKKRIEDRVGAPLTDGKDYGFMAKVQVGKSQISRAKDWNASLAYRYLGSDAVLDAFTNSDFGLGGTNSKGFILGANYGIFNNTWLSLRWMSSSPIASFAPGSVPRTRLSVDTVQFDLNVRF